MICTSEELGDYFDEYNFKCKPHSNNLYLKNKDDPGIIGLLKLGS